MRHRIALTTAGIALASIAQASYRGAEIRYAPVDGVANTYIVTVDQYRDLDGGDRPEINLDFGDGSSAVVPRTLVQDFETASTCGPVRLSTYSIAHTYPGPGSYTIRSDGELRRGGIINIPNSIAQGACVEALLVIDPLLGTNTSITFDTLQFRTRRQWNTLIHEPAPVEPDGDSLTFELATPLGSGCTTIQGYAAPVGMNYVWLDPITGTYFWDYPATWGDHSLALRGSEWRNGQLIGQVTRDMSLCVVGFFAGISDRAAQEVCSLLPNPSNDLVNIQNWTGGPLWVEFFSTNGRLAKTLWVNAGVSTLSVTDLSSGIHSVHFQDEQGLLIRTVRFLKP